MGEQVIRALRPVTLIPRVNGLMVVVNTLYQVSVAPKPRFSSSFLYEIVL